jgi:putative hydrolase of the HAD superfamily
MQNLSNKDNLFIPAINSNIKAVIFDCDGVLCPPLRFADLLDKEYGITCQMTADFFSGIFNKALVDEVKVIEILPSYLEKWGWQKSAQEFLNLWLESEKEIRPELINLIKELKTLGYFVGLATNQESERANYLRTVMGFYELFDNCFISSELKLKKPQAEYYQKITSMIGVKPNQILFIDDQQNYLDSANQIGWHTILYNDFLEVQRNLALILKK